MYVGARESFAVVLETAEVDGGVLYPALSVVMRLDGGLAGTVLFLVTSPAAFERFLVALDSAVVDGGRPLGPAPSVSMGLTAVGVDGIVVRAWVAAIVDMDGLLGPALSAAVWPATVDVRVREVFVVV